MFAALIFVATALIWKLLAEINNGSPDLEAAALTLNLSG